MGLHTSVRKCSIFANKSSKVNCSRRQGCPSHELWNYYFKNYPKWSSQLNAKSNFWSIEKGTHIYNIPLIYVL